jgi:cation transporter-like permease
VSGELLLTWRALSSAVDVITVLMPLMPLPSGNLTAAAAAATTV